MDETGVAACPNLAGLQRRRRDAEHHAKAALLRVLHGGRAGRLFAGAFGAAPVRSGLIFSQCRPPSVVFITYCVPRYSVFFSIGEKTSIGVQGSRYLRSLISLAKFGIGHGVMSWLSEVRRSQRTTLP